MPKAALITGGAGFIGSHLAELLLSMGQEVHIADNFSTGRIENIDHLISNPNFSFHAGDISNSEWIDPIVSKCSEIYHLAAAVGVKLIIEKPIETIITNVIGTKVILEMAYRYGIKILIASTSEIYGKNKNGSLREDDDRIMGSVTKQRWAYANTKTLDEFLSLAYHREYGLPIVIVRMFNTVGPRQTGRYGMVIPNFVRAAIDGKPIRVFGDGQQTRCFAYVGDVVRCLADLMGHPGAVGNIFNIGNDKEISIIGLAEKVKEITGSSSPIVLVPYKEAYGEGFEDMERRVPDLAKVNALVGYEPNIQLDEILRNVVEYFKANELDI